MRRSDWLKERLNGIGASDAAAVIGVSPYISNEELWEIKTGRKIPDDIGDKPYVKFGTEAEKHIRALFALDNPQYRVGYEEFKITRNPDHPFLFATLDGWLTDEHRRTGVWECKTTEILRANQWAEWTDGIPDHYYVQVLHQLLATGYDFAVLTVRIKHTDRSGKKKSVTQDYHIERQTVTDDLDFLLKEEIKFWELVQADRRPPLMLPQI